MINSNAARTNYLEGGWKRKVRSSSFYFLPDHLLFCKLPTTHFFIIDSVAIAFLNVSIVYLLSTTTDTFAPPVSSPSFIPSVMTAAETKGERRDLNEYLLSAIYVANPKRPNGTTNFGVVTCQNASAKSPCLPPRISMLQPTL